MRSSWIVTAIPAAREAYTKLLAALHNSGDSARAAVVARRLALLDLVHGDRAPATRNLDAYRASGGKNGSIGTAPAPKSPENAGTANIPGPLRSFARMAALSPDSSPEDILPALARNVVTNGYQASHNNEALEQTEYLKLVHRYLSQAHELEKLAGESRVIKIETCEAPAPESCCASWASACAAAAAAKWCSKPSTRRARFSPRIPGSR